MSTQSSLRKTVGGAQTTTSAVAKRLWPYVKPVVGMLLLGVVAMACSSGTDALIPMLLKPLLDHGFGANASHRAVWFVPLAVIGLAFVRGVSQYASQYLL